VRVVLGKCFLDFYIQFRLTRKAILTSSETRIVSQILTSNRAADVVKEFIIERRNLNVAPIFTSKSSVRRIEWASVPHARLNIVAQEELTDLRRLNMNLTVEQTHLDLLTNALLLAGPQADHRRKRHQIGARGVGNRRSSFERFPILLASDA